MKVDNGTTNFAVYEDATEFYGMAEVTLPEISQIAEEVKGAGISGITGVRCPPRQRRNPRFPHIFCRILYLTLDGGANLWYDRGAVLFVSEMALIDAAYCNSRFWLPRPRRTRSGTVPSGVRGVHWLCDIPVPGRWRNVRVRQEERAEPTGRSSQFCGGLRFCSERLCRSG